MNQQQIAELRELKAKATPGEWRADWDDNGQWYIEPLGLTGHALRGDESDCIESATAQSIAALHNSADAKRAKPRRGPAKDENYLDFVRTLPCVACWSDIWHWSERFKTILTIG